jgi:hypothetical protein
MPKNVNVVEILDEMFQRAVAIHRPPPENSIIDRILGELVTAGSYSANVADTKV